MSSKPKLQVAEWQALELPTSLDNKRSREQIVRAAHSARGPALRHGSGTVKARGLVGLVSTAHVDIQIVPKVYLDDDDHEAGARLMRAMLAAELSFPSSIQIAQTASVEGPIIEVVIGYIANVLLDQLLTGVPRRYQEFAGDMNVLRGKIDLRRQARRMPSNAHQVPVRYAPLQRDNALSRLFKAVADYLLQLSLNASHRRKLQECIDLLEDVKTVPLTLHLVEQAMPNRLEEDWAWLAGIAQSLAINRSPDLIGPGEHGGLAILFPLDGLFEGLIRRAIRRGLQGTLYGLQPSKGIGRLFQHLATNEEVMKLEPDIVIVSGDTKHRVVIGDVKWKRQKADAAMLPERNDAFQMLAYLNRLGLNSGFLCYPSSRALGTTCRWEEVTSLRQGIKVRLIEIDVAKLISGDGLIVSQAERDLVAAMPLPTLQANG